METNPNQHNRYQKMKTKIQFLRADLHFLKKCKFHHVFPKFIELGFKCSVKNRRTSEVLQTAKLKWLNLEIKTCYRKLNQIELETYALHIRLSNEYDADE
jgi:type II secretory pathway component PulJ